MLATVAVATRLASNQVIAGPKKVCLPQPLESNPILARKYFVKAFILRQ